MFKKFSLFGMLIASLLFAGCGGDGGGNGGDEPVVRLCDLLITEFMADPKNPKKTGYEWIEIYNPADEAMDLRDFRLFLYPTGKSTQTLVFKGQDMIPIPGKSYFLLHQTEDETEKFDDTGAVPTYWYPKTFAMPISSFRLVLRDLNGAEVFKLEVGADDSCSAELPTIPPAKLGISTELQPDFMECASDTGNPFVCGAWGFGWKAAIPGSSDLGTPGAAPEVRFTADPPQPGDIAVTELMSYSHESCGDLTWFEIRNLRDQAFSLEGCILADASATGINTIAGPVKIPASSENGGYAVLAKSEISGVNVAFIYGTKPSLNKTGDLLKLSCPPSTDMIGSTADYQTLFEITWGGGEGELPACPAGKSIAVFDDLIEADLGAGFEPTVEILHNPAYWAATPRGLMGCGENLGSPGKPNPLFNCTPQCEAGVCGNDDGCGSTCGCSANATCVENACVCSVVPDCTNKKCGDDGCGGSCGTCGEGEACAVSETGAVCVAVPVAGQIMPVEIMPAASTGCLSIDWFELQNFGSKAVDLKGCVFGDATETGRSTIKGNLVVEAGDVLLLAAAAHEELLGAYIFGSKPTLNNSGDRLFMECPGDADQMNMIFDITYGSAEGDLPVPPQGLSIQICPDRLPEAPVAADILDPANWIVSSSPGLVCGDKGSPGVKNLPCDCETICDLLNCDIDDGCGGTCGCSELAECNAEKTCVCSVNPDCSTKECGDNGCGGSCGSCAEGETCVSVTEGNYCAAVPSVGEIVPTEISSVTGAGCGGYDWFEIWNISDRTLNLQGCSFGDASASGAFKISATLLIKSGALMVYSSGDMAGVSEGVVSSKPNLNATGPENVWLSCPDAGGNPVEIFKVTYGGTGNIPNPTAGASVQFCPESLLGGEADSAKVLNVLNWAVTKGPVSACSDLGTPGELNASCSCVKTCSAGTCGMSDGCGGTCSCGDNAHCDNGNCVCDQAGSCDNKECGDNGCGASCGVCGAGLSCLTEAGMSLCVSSVPPAAGEVVPTEIMSRSTGGCLSSDWFELYNPTLKNLNLAGCTIYDATLSGKKVINKNVIIKAKDYVVIAAADMPGVEEDFLSSVPNLNQNDEDLGLDCPTVDGGTVTVFKVHYGTAAGSLPSTAAGASISVCMNLLPENATAADYLNPANWKVTLEPTMACGADKGSPGVKNADCACVPTCADGKCGMDNGCGTPCGCETGSSCKEGSCVADCVPSCEVGKCGMSDGCTGTCGCLQNQTCEAGVCKTNCTPSCQPGKCGMDNGCGTPCGCDSGYTCNQGVCEKVNLCVNKECGSDGAGGSCGTCGEGLGCAEGTGFAKCAKVPAAGDLILTEFLVNTAACTPTTKDWFEVRNISGKRLNLGNCLLNDSTATPGTIKTVTLIEPDDYLVFVQDVATSTLNLGTTKVFFYGSTPNLNADTDKIGISCNSVQVFNYTYGGTGNLPVPALKDGKKVSVQLSMNSGVTPTKAESEDPTKWCASTSAITCGDVGTPGADNVTCQ